MTESASSRSLQTALCDANHDDITKMNVSDATTKDDAATGQAQAVQDQNGIVKTLSIMMDQLNKTMQIMNIAMSKMKKMIHDIMMTLRFRRLR